jgi:CheY-like chemotaxis protein
MSAQSEFLRPRPEKTTHSARVLVVDDELFVVQALRIVLAREFDVTGTTSPEQALEWIETGESYDVILCDVSMPRVSGVALRDRIARISTEQASRVVFLTEGALVPEALAALDSGPALVLEKPIDLESLRELIRHRARRAWQGADCAI